MSRLKSQQAEKVREALAAARDIIKSARLVAQLPDQAQWKKVLAWFEQQIAALKN
jgi:hypothetical protein